MRSKASPKKRIRTSGWFKARAIYHFPSVVTMQYLVKVVLRILSFSSLTAMVLVGYPYKFLLLPRLGDLLTSPSMDWHLEKAIPSLV